MAQLFSNNAETTLAAPLTDSATSVTFTDGSLFRTPTGGDFERLTLIVGGTVEIVSLTARSGNTGTITRAQEGTTALAWGTGTRVFAGVTKGTLETMLQNAGTGTQSVAIEAVGSGNYSVAAGFNAAATQAGAVAIGGGQLASEGAQATGDRSISVGSQSLAPGVYAVGIGYAARADAANAIAIGYSCTAEGQDSITIRGDNYGQDAINVGRQSFIPATSPEAVAIGRRAIIGSDSGYSVNIGSNSELKGANAILIGSGVNSFFASGNSILIGSGYSFISNGAGSTVIGKDIGIDGATDALAMGTEAYIEPGAHGGIAIGKTSTPAARTLQVAALPVVPNTHWTSQWTYSEANAAWKMAGSQSVILSEPLDLKTLQTHTIPIPTGVTFFVEEVGVIVTAATGVTGQPTLRFGVTGTEERYLAAAATTGLAAAHDRQRFTTLASAAGAKTLRSEITVAATGTTLNGRVYWKGFAVVDHGFNGY